MRVLLLLSLCGFGAATITPTLAAELPPNWPWRGIVMTSAASPNEDDIKYLAEIGANTVVLHVDLRFEAQQHNESPALVWKRDIAWTDRILDACKKHGMTALISVYQIPADPKLGLTQESPEFWNDPARRQEAIDIAERLARHFKDRGPELGAYSILSEPVLRIKGNPVLPPAWPELMSSIVKAIRRHDQKRYITVTPCLGGLPANYGGARPLDDPYIVYEAHMYVPGTFTHQGIYENPLGVNYPGFTSLRYWNRKALEEYMAPLIAFQKKNKALIFVGEFSAVRWAQGSEHYLNDLIDMFDNQGWGWSYFEFNSWHGWDPSYDSVYSTNEDARKHYVGKDSARWKLLRETYAKNKVRGADGK